MDISNAGANSSKIQPPSISRHRRIKIEQNKQSCIEKHCKRKGRSQGHVHTQAISKVKGNRTLNRMFVVRFSNCCGIVCACLFIFNYPLLTKKRRCRYIFIRRILDFLSICPLQVFRLIL